MNEIMFIIVGKGIPTNIATRRATTPIQLYNAATLADMYPGRLNEPGPYVRDVFSSREAHINALNGFNAMYTSLEPVYNATVQGNGIPLYHALTHLIQRLDRHAN